MTNPLDDTRNPYRIGINSNFPNLVADFTYWDKYLRGKTFNEFLAETRKKFNLPARPSSERIAAIPKHDAYNFSLFDTHGDKWSVEAGVSAWLEDVIEGRKSYLTFHGDDCDALPEYSENEPLIKPATDADAQKMHVQNLAFNSERGFLILAYPDNSVQNLAQKIILRRAFPELCNFLIGDHELPLLYPEYKIFKAGFDLSKNVAGRLTEEEKTFVKSELSAMPLYVVTENGFLLGHNVPSSSTKKQLENLIYDESGKSALENALFCDEARNKECKGEKFDEVRIYDKRKIAAFLKEMGAVHALIGHTANSDFVYVDETGDERPILGGVAEYSREFEDFTIGATTEHKNANKARSGQDRMGPNEDGIYCAIKLDANPDKLNFGKLGQGTIPYYIPKKKEAAFKKEKTEKDKTVSVLITAVRELAANGGFAEKYAKSIEYAAPLLEEDIKTRGMRKEIVEETIKAFKENDARGIAEYLDGVSRNDALYFIPEEMKFYFTIKNNHY